MPKAPKTRNNGTMTEAAFWSMIRSHLRRKTVFWKPKSEAIKRASRKYVGENKRRKIEVQCAKCEGWFARDSVEVDHIIEAGSLRSFDDLSGFLERLFCEVDGFQVLCKPCHKLKTNNNANKC
jgi:hypothetical protein